MGLDNFPQLSNEQVALMRAAKATGVILDEDFKTLISDEQKMFTVFENLQQAKMYIDKILILRDDVDLTVFDKDQTMLVFIH